MQKVCFVALLVTLLAAAAYCLTIEQNIPGRFVVSFHTEKRIPNKWTATGRAEQQTIVNFNILLKQKNLDLLVNKLYEVSDPKSASYGKYLSLSEVQSISAPAQEVVDRVVKFTQVAGVKYTLVNGDFLTVSATVEAIESLFQTKLYVFTHVKTQKKIIRHLGALSVPAALQNDIDFVLGLSEFLDDTKFKPSSLKSKASNDISITPSVLRTYYKVPSTEVASSSKSLSGIIAFQDRYSAQALQQFDQLYNVKSSIVKTIGPDCLDQGCDQTESDLDVQYTTALGSGVPIWFWNHDPNVWVLGYLLDMASTANPPFINSISYGWGEVYQCDDGIGGTECSQYGYNSQQYVQRCDAEFVKAGLRGITIFVSSGDDGASGRTGACNNGQGYPQLSPEYPGSSPFVTSVGATQFLGGSSSINEVVCSINTNALITSGGGFNAYQTRPYWQDAAVKAYLQNNAGKLPNPSYFNASNRGYPDITLNGHNYQIYVTDDGSDNCPCSLEAVDGTSCSSPTSAGIFGLVNDALFKNGKSSLGFLNPVLYQMAADNPQSFFDITQGDNTCTSQTCGCSGYFAAAGWDPVSGLGSLNYSEIKKYILTIKAN